MDWKRDGRGRYRAVHNGGQFVMERAPTGCGGYWTSGEMNTPGFIVKPSENIGTMRECRQLTEARTA